MSEAKRTFGRLSRLWRRRAFRVGVFVAVASAGFGIATCLDGPTHQLLHPENRESFMSHDLWRMLRSVGYLPAWVALVAALLLHDWRRAGPGLPGHRRWPNRRGWLVLIVAGAAGASNAVLKVLLRRLRPPTRTAWDGHYVFRSWADKPFSTGGFGLPSSHATIAFAGMFLLGRMYPKASPVFILLAAGCALARVATRGHFLSDIAASAMLGWGLAWAAWRFLPGWRGDVKTPSNSGPSD